jgi:hypothetical protein
MFKVPDNKTHLMCKWALSFSFLTAGKGRWKGGQMGLFPVHVCLFNGVTNNILDEGHN